MGHRLLLPKMKFYLIAFMSVHSSIPSTADSCNRSNRHNKAFRSPEQKFAAPAANPCLTALLDADSDHSARTVNTLAHKVLHSIWMSSDLAQCLEHQGSKNTHWTTSQPSYCNSLLITNEGSLKYRISHFPRKKKIKMLSIYHMLSSPHIISVFILTMFILQTRKQNLKSQPWETV